MECSNAMLTSAMAEAGARNGFTDVTAEFSAFRDFKLKWTRTSNWISLEVSDYLRDAPRSVIESLAETVFARIGGEDGKEYSEEVCEYLNSQGFLRDNQELFLKRFRGISQTTCGENVDLAEVYRRLVESGLVEHDSRLVIRWADTTSRTRSIGRTSVIMKTIIMNPALDSEELSENALDYALYTQVARVGMGFGPGGERRESEYEALLDRFDGRKEAMEELSRIRS